MSEKIFQVVLVVLLTGLLISNILDLYIYFESKKPKKVDLYIHSAHELTHDSIEIIHSKDEYWLNDTKIATSSAEFIEIVKKGIKK